MDSESAVLSAVLKDKQIHVLLQAGADKFFTTYKDVWEFVRDYHEMSEVMPPLDLVEQKFPDFEYDDSVGATKYHLNELKGGYLKSRVSSTLREAGVLSRDGDHVGALDLLMKASSEIKRELSTVRDIDMTDVEDAVQYYKLVEEMNAKGSFGIKTGLKGFDSYLPAGMLPGHFGILLAYPQIGKSWLMLYFAIQAWLQGKSVMILSLEMSESEVRNRAYTIMGDGAFSHRKLSAGEVDIDDFKRWGEKHLANRPAFQVISGDGMGEITPAVLRGKIDQYRPDIVFVDYIQLMNSNTGGNESEASKIKNISREFKLLAGMEQVPIIAIASATPDDVTDMSSPPGLGQVRWGKDIAYDADYVIALGRDPNDNIIDVVFRKNRHGFLGEFLIEVDFDSGVWISKDFEDIG